MTPEQHDLWFLPLGGTGEIGMNMNLYGHDGQWLMVDCGVIFNKETDVDGQLLGKQAPHVQMADPQFIVDRKQQLQGLIITHAHEDHIGAVPYLWERLQCPIYTTAFTAEVLRRKLVEVGLSDKVTIKIVAANNEQQIGKFKVKWLALTHSIPEPFALLISTPAGKVFHTADWKLDPSPVLGASYNPKDYGKLAELEIDAMVCDSTNATVQGWSDSEASLYKGLKAHVENAKGRVIIACFGSNLARLNTIARIARETERHLGLLGRSLINMMSVAKSVGLWPDQETDIDPTHLGYLPAHTVLIVATGSQGEPRTALQRLSLNSYRDVQLEPGDTVIFSSKVIPGNEIAINALVDRLKAMNVTVINEDNSALKIHASGHPAADELKAMYNWVKPKYSVPVHGESHHLKANAAIAKANDVPYQLVGSNGDIFCLGAVKGIRRSIVQTGRLGLVKKSLVNIY